MNTTLLSVAAERLRRRMPSAQPCLAMILGSGWREAARGFRILRSVNYEEIPELGAPQVAGHAGQLMWAEFKGTELLVFSGRRHWYEGIGWEPVALPVFLARVFGATGIVLTNSAGGLRQDFSAGTVMAIDDHINLMGTHPLMGPHTDIWGPRFPDMSAVYDQDYRQLLDTAALRAGVLLRHGIYAAVTGPTYETPAETAAFRRLGADAVGMSTVPEAILAHSAGLRVAGLSCITNAAGTGTALSHSEVLAHAEASAPLLARLLVEFVSLAGTQHMNGRGKGNA